MAKAEGVALNQLINVALAEKWPHANRSILRALHARSADVAKALAILTASQVGEPPREGDELPESWKNGAERDSEAATEGGYS